MAPSAPHQDPTVIVAGARTPFGKLLGALKSQSGTDLGAVAIRGALEKSGVDPQTIDYVIMGQVLTAGAGQMPARQAAIKAGIGWDVPAMTINKVCLSGLDAVALAAQLIRAGEFDVAPRAAEPPAQRHPHGEGDEDDECGHGGHGAQHGRHHRHGDR